MPAQASQCARQLEGFVRPLQGGCSDLDYDTEKGADTEYRQDEPAQYEEQHACDPADHQSEP